MRERFAPSPSGHLHLGHAFSALTAWSQAQINNSLFLIRMEDIDQARCRVEFENQIYADLKWLGLSWELPVVRQSERQFAYEAALNQLIKKDLCYYCDCTRADIASAISAPQEHPAASQTMSPDGPVYPGTCRNNRSKSGDQIYSVRLDMRKAIAYLGGPNAVEALSFGETGDGTLKRHFLNAEQLINLTGDIVLARKDIGTSYHLSVVVDDAFQNITHVTRGQDIFSATFIHVILQKLLGLPTPIYHHHRLIRDANGRRLAKRDGDYALSRYRAEGLTAAQVRSRVGF